MPGAIAFAEQLVPVRADYTFSKDSDGVVSHTYSIRTNEDEAAWNFSTYHTQLLQSGQELSENTFLTKWRKDTAAGAVSAWLGYVDNRIRSEAFGAIMYDFPVGRADHMWVSYGTEPVDTVLAHRGGIDKHTASVSYLCKLDRNVDAVFSSEISNYTDNNEQKKYGVVLEKQISNYLKTGLHYVSNKADHPSSPIYYVPTNENVLSARAEWVIPFDKGRFSLVGEHYIDGRTNGVQTQRKNIDVSLSIGQFTLGEKYDRDVGYNSRSIYFRWDAQF